MVNVRLYSFLLSFMAFMNYNNAQELNKRNNQFIDTLGIILYGEQIHARYSQKQPGAEINYSRFSITNQTNTSMNLVLKALYFHYELKSKTIYNEKLEPVFMIRNDSDTISMTKPIMFKPHSKTTITVVFKNKMVHAFNYNQAIHYKLTIGKIPVILASPINVFVYFLRKSKEK